MEKHVYTDGSCIINPGFGGFGVITTVDVPICTGIAKTIFYSISEVCAHTTNNREELKAMIHALKLAKNDPENSYVIYSDSAYVVNMCNDWIFKWAANGWQNSKKKTVENVDLVQSLYKYLNTNFQNFQIKKVKGHAGIVENELADALARADFDRYKKLIKDNNLFFATAIKEK